MLQLNVCHFMSHNTPYLFGRIAKFYQARINYQMSVGQGEGVDVVFLNDVNFEACAVNMVLSANFSRQRISRMFYFLVIDFITRRNQSIYKKVADFFLRGG